MLQRISFPANTFLSSLLLLSLTLLSDFEANAQLVNRAVVETGTTADLLSLPLPNQRGMFSDDLGQRYAFYTKSVAGSDDCSLQLYRSADDGLTWTAITSLPDIGDGICQEDVSASLASDGCSLHTIWTMRESPTDNKPRLAYGVYDICADSWFGIEEVRPDENGFTPDITLYKKGSQDLPIIGYTTADPSGRSSWINFKKTASSWLYPQSGDAFSSADQDYYLGTSLHQKGASLKYYGSLRGAAGLCPFETQLYGREVKRSTFSSPAPSYLIHGFIANLQSYFVDAGGNIWICYIAEKDAGCSPGQEIYTLRLPAVGSLVNVYGISDMETGAPFSSSIAGENHYNFAITSVDGAPTVVYSRFADNYEVIYTSTFDGFDFGPPAVFYSQPGEQYLRFQTLKEDLDCLQFSALSVSASGQEAVYFSDCGAALKSNSSEGLSSESEGFDFVLAKGDPIQFPTSFQNGSGKMVVFDALGRIQFSYAGSIAAIDLTNQLSSGLHFYSLQLESGASLSGKLLLK